MPIWAGPIITPEEAFLEITKGKEDIEPDFYFPINSPRPSSGSASITSAEDHDEIVTARILAGFKAAAGDLPATGRKRSFSSSRDGESSEEDQVASKKRLNGSAVPVKVGGKKGGEGGKQATWKARPEFAYLMSVVSIPPVGRQKISFFGKACGRNEIIGDIVTISTGHRYDRKSISSHAQVLKNRKDISRTLSNLFTTEESRSPDAEGGPTVYSLPPDWTFPTCLNQLMGIPENVDVRFSEPPAILDRPALDISVFKKTPTSHRKKLSATPSSKQHRAFLAANSESPMTRSDSSSSSLETSYNSLLPTPRSSFHHSPTHADKADRLTPPPDYGRVLLYPPTKGQTQCLGLTFGNDSNYNQPRLPPISSIFGFNAIPPPGRALMPLSTARKLCHPESNTRSTYAYSALGYPYAAFEAESVKSVAKPWGRLSLADLGLAGPRQSI
ncbi:hypothetical protein CI109_101873 [Kwoniella shandongensis]|uniref:Uncharacterized protein n=1 Tax=Kwoniella shandongensis TaxID=1734106 RepID=A0A5M6BNZ0_9TREE|nr:uncharacterized protein CI109_007049 [Kwoniella shandongensis]KAA5524614.1 hypothetical protein CI109_007049 [Kwoniella shandongensis]